MTRTKTIIDHSIWRNLPPEIIGDVLSRLPIKSLCRFKCVSPSWNSLISSPGFAETHLHISGTPNKPQKTILISSSHALYSVDFAAANPTAEKLDFTLPVDPVGRPGNRVRVWGSVPGHRVRGWGSCNGLDLVSDQGLTLNLFLLNPFTRECKKLPQSPLADLCLYEDPHVFQHGLGYDSSTDDYKVVMLFTRPITDSNGFDYINNGAVYSLKIDAWRRIQDSHYIPVGLLQGVYFNERLHWLWRSASSGSKVVVAFDLWDEVFREVPLPTSFYNYKLGPLVLGSCLCLVVSPFEGDGIEVWMMKKYGVRESWTKFSMAKHWMFVEDVLYLAAEAEFVLRISELIEEVNGVGIIDESSPGKLVVYNPKKETLRDMVVCGIPTKYTVGGNYIETLVSPNHGGQIRRHYEAS